MSISQHLTELEEFSELAELIATLPLSDRAEALEHAVSDLLSMLVQTP